MMIIIFSQNEFRTGVKKEEENYGLGKMSPSNPFIIINSNTCHLFHDIHYFPCNLVCIGLFKGIWLVRRTGAVSAVTNVHSKDC